MNNIRLGNDIPLQWTVTRGSSPVDLRAAVSLKVFIVAAMVKFEVSVRVTGEQRNVLQLTFRGADQRYCGTYHLLLVVNEGLDNMIVIDSADAFRIVPVTENGLSAPVALTDLTSDIIVPASGFSAYQLAVIHGYQGSEDEWVAEYNASLQAALEAAENANESAEHAEGVIVDIQTRLARGEFKGERGEPGEPGEPGQRGPSGAVLYPTFRIEDGHLFAIVPTTEADMVITLENGHLILKI